MKECIKKRFVLIIIFVVAIIALYCYMLPHSIVFTNINVVAYVEQYGKQKRYITEEMDKKRLLNMVSNIKIMPFQNHHILCSDDGIVITIYGKGILYRNKEVSVVHIYISEKNEINTIEIDEKDYCFKKENISLEEYSIIAE